MIGNTIELILNSMSMSVSEMISREARVSQCHGDVDDRLLNGIGKIDVDII